MPRPSRERCPRSTHLRNRSRIQGTHGILPPHAKDESPWNSSDDVVVGMDSARAHMYGSRMLRPVRSQSAAVRRILPEQADAVSGTSGVAGETRTGRASFIANSLNGKKTASGEPYERHQARRSSSVVPARDDSPCDQSGERPCRRGQGGDRTGIAGSAPHSMIDLSRAAAERLDFVTHGTAPVTTESSAGRPPKSTLVEYACRLTSRTSSPPGPATRGRCTARAPASDPPLASR